MPPRIMVGAALAAALRAAGSRLHIWHPILGGRDLGSLLRSSVPPWLRGRDGGIAGAQLQQCFKFSLLVEPLPLDALLIASQYSPAHISIERRKLHTQQSTGLAPVQVVFTV